MTASTRTARSTRRALLIFIAIGSMAAGAVLVSGNITRLPGETQLPIGAPRNQALHIKMRDGVRIAVDVWLPPDLASDATVPALMQMTRYWRAHETGFLARALTGLRLLDAQRSVPALVDYFNRAGYAVVLVDARGSGASFGSRAAELAPDEIEDYGEIVDWIVAQGWSNGRVGAMGVSYDGITAERLVATRRSAVKAVVPLYADFDFQLGVMQPGGASLNFIKLWSDMVGALDRNEVCAANGLESIHCWITRLLSPGVKPVDADHDGALLTRAVEEHARNLPLEEAFRHVEFRDDRYGETPHTIADLNTYSHRNAIEAAGTPMQIWLGWFDAATVHGGLSRFLTVANPQDVIIGPFSHGGEHDTDPYNPAGAPVSPELPAQYAHMARFLDRFLKSQGGTAEHKITYYTMGARRWCETTLWPPANVEQHTMFLGENGTLTATDEPRSEGADTYSVDFTHSTGPRNRWQTNLDYGDVVYDDRAVESAKLLTYASEPLERDTIITGSPVLTFWVASSEPDVVFHAYLESLGPDGGVFHLAEGVLRSVNHVLSDQPAPSEVLSPPRSFTRADSRPLAPGQVTEIKLALTPVSVQVPAGHRLRLAISGADRSMFIRRPEGATPRWTIYRGAATPSRMILPLETPGTCRIVNPF